MSRIYVNSILIDVTYIYIYIYIYIYYIYMRERESQLLLVSGNKLFLCSFWGFNEAKHILINTPAKIWLLYAKKTKVITSIE